MRRLIPTALFSILLPHSASAFTYHVGPGQPYAAIGDVPWESISAGDSALIEARPAPYREKWVICRVGTEAQPIVVRGLPDGQGNLPVIDGMDATTRPQLNFWSENRGIIKIGGANSPLDVMPAWIVIENLEIRGARPENTFTGRNGLTAYGNNAASIYVEKGQHIVIRGCHLHDCSNGFFCAWQTTDLLVEFNHLEDNGNIGSIYEHNNYTEALGIVFQYNRMGPLRAGAGGNNLKDRSAGTVIRTNWIEGGNRQLDLVDSDFSELYDDPSYRSTFVYGNVLIEHDADGNSQVAHYGGDSGITGQYRKGTLYFHHNTVVSERAGNTTLLRLSSSGESADVRNNIVYVTAAGNRLAMLDQSGTLTITRNWLKTGWVPTHSGGSVNLIDQGQVTGTSPGFLDLSTYDFELVMTSPCIGEAAPLLPAVIPDHVPVREYVRHRLGRPRLDDGDPDIGAYEYGSATGVSPEPGPVPAGLAAFPNPFSGRCEIRVPGSSPIESRLPLEIIDVAGRRVAEVQAGPSGSWIWTPGRETKGGVYFARRGSLKRKIVYGP